MNKNLKIVIILVIFGLSSVLAKQLFFNDPAFKKVMLEAASELNQSCPMMVDEETRLDNANVMGDDTFQYNYTLVNLEHSSVNISEMENFLEPMIVNLVRTNPDLEIYRENNITMAYNYKDRNGQFLLRILVTPDKYID